MTSGHRVLAAAAGVVLVLLLAAAGASASSVTFKVTSGKAVVGKDISFAVSGTVDEADFLGADEFGNPQTSAAVVFSLPPKPCQTTGPVRSMYGYDVARAGPFGPFHGTTFSSKPAKVGACTLLFTGSGADEKIVASSRTQFTVGCRKGYKAKQSRCVKQ